MKQEQEHREKPVAELLAAAEAADAQDDAPCGRGIRRDELPEELRPAPSRLEQIRATQAERLAEAAAQAEEKKESPFEDAQTTGVLDEMTRIAASSHLRRHKKDSRDSEDDPQPPLQPGELPRKRIPADQHGLRTAKRSRRPMERNHAAAR